MMKLTKRRIFEIIQVGKDQDKASIIFDFFIAGVICINLFITLFATFDEAEPYMGILNTVDLITMIIFAVEYGLRLWTADYLYPKKKPFLARRAFIFSFFGVIDVLTFLPYFLPVFFPAGIGTFRLLRVIRILRLFRVNAYYDAFNIITDVLNEKKNQIFSSVCMILILMLASSLLMYNLEHEAQPDKFQNAFSGIWWSVSTLLTVGYGDICPITPIGQVVAIFIAFLGVGMVAIPTGIISAGFVEHYTKAKTSLTSNEADIRFITLTIEKGMEWENSLVKDISLPHGLILAVIQRGHEIIVPRGDTLLLAGDHLVVGAEGYKDEIGIKLQEIVLRERHPWDGKAVKDLNISRQTLLVMVRRQGKIIIPHGSLVMQAGDMVVLYTKRNVRDSVEINL